MLKRLLKILIPLGILAGILGWFLSAPSFVDPADFASLRGDSVRGKQVFHASGCSSCHAAKGASGEEKLVLAGGLHFETPFGTFIAPNISPSDAGIGDWSVVDLANAMQHGTSPDGRHYYPAFPYTSYVRMTAQDIADLHSYLQTLPANDTPSAAHDVGFPFNIRRGLGLWKLLYLDGKDKADIDAADAQLARGQYLVEGPGHCGECHTPRNAIGGWKSGQWLAGGPNPDGAGMIPNITPHALAWTAAEIQEYLATGFTPEFDVVGGSMVAVQENMAELPAEDLAAMAAYLKAIEAAQGDQR